MIVIPSYKRPESCITATYLSEATVAVHEFEADDYADEIDNDLLVIPDDLQKTGMSTIRNYILDSVDDDEVCMMDDDITYIGCYEDQERKQLTEDAVYHLVENGFQMCADMGTTLWGLNLQTDKKFYREYSPFSTTSVVLGPFMGIIKDPDIRFDERLGLKEDYDYALQVLNKHRRILRFNKYHYMAQHIEDSGGAATYRTLKREQEQAERLQQKWGPDIVRNDRKTQGGNDSINPRVRVPITGI